MFQQFLNLSSSQQDMSGPTLGALSNNRWSEGTFILTILTYKNQISEVIYLMLDLWFHVALYSHVFLALDFLFYFFDSAES